MTVVYLPWKCIWTHIRWYIVCSTTQNSSLQIIEFTFYQDREPTTGTQRKKLKYQILVDTLEHATWYVTLIILIACIQGSIHANNITNLFEQCYIHVMPVHACMQIIHLIDIKYLTLFMLSKLENLQQPLLPI